MLLERAQDIGASVVHLSIVFTATTTRSAVASGRRQVKGHAIPRLRWSAGQHSISAEKVKDYNTKKDDRLQLYSK